MSGKTNTPTIVNLPTPYDISFFKYTNAQGGFIGDLLNKFLLLNAWDDTIGIYVTNDLQSKGDYPSVIAPAANSVSGLTSNLNELIVKTKFPVYLRTTDNLNFWHKDVLINGDFDNDNSDVCFDLYGWGITFSF